MLSEGRWAPLYGFLRELWAGRSRVLADPALEAALRAAKTLPPSLAALLAELLPAGAGATKAWLLAYDAKGAGRGRGQVVGFDGFDDLLSSAPWQIALVDLAQHFVDAATLSRFAARAEGRLENRLDTRAFRLLATLAEAVEGGRIVVVSAPGEGAGGLDLTQFQELVTQHFPRARIYAQASAAAATVVDCGEVTSEEEEDLEEDERGPPPLAFDNSLAEEVRYAGYFAVVGAREAPRGVTILELPGGEARPAAAPARARASTPPQKSDEEGLRGQLAQARRQLELASIARHSLVEQLDAAQARIDALEDQLGAAASAAGEAPAEAPARGDVAAAREQSLRWELEQARTELRRLTARPPEELERRFAEAQARLAAALQWLSGIDAALEGSQDLAAMWPEGRERLRAALALKPHP